MPDYLLPISASSTMMIRDTGGWVEFWFKTGPSTWNNDQWWSWAANGTGARSKFRLLRGGAWQHFGSVYITYDQTIRFTIEGAGIGGWVTTDFFQHIQRTTVPAPPTMLSVTPTSSSTFHVVFQGSYDGGSPVLEWQLGYGISPNGPTSFVGSSGTSDVGGFTSGQKIYFWARGRNALGWSLWSNRGEGTTWMVPLVPGRAIISNIKQTSVGVLYLYNSRVNDPAVIEREIRYSKDPAGVVGVEVVTAINGVNNFDDLDPGETYYFWARARNSVGWSAWSISTRVDLIAGARVLVGAEWKRAVPYVRVDGEWKVAEVWVKNAGTWKRVSV